MDKVKALADYLGISVDEIVEEYSNLYEVDDGSEYLVLTEDEAYDAAKEDISSVMDDLGLESFTENFQSWILENAVDETVVDDFIQQEIDYYTDDEQDDEMVDMLQNLEGSDKVEYIRDLFGDEQFSKWLNDNSAFDINKIAEEAIDWDGVAHFISTYDGKEINLGNDLYAYRVN